MTRRIGVMGNERARTRVIVPPGLGLGVQFTIFDADN